MKRLRTSGLSCLMLCCMLMQGCSLPRIVVLGDPLTPEEHVNLGLSYERKGETDAAIGEYEKAAERLPVAFLYLGNLRMQSGRPDEAEKDYKEAIERDPSLSDAYNNLAWLYLTKGENLPEAERLSLKAVELAPEKENYRDTLDKVREALKAR